MVEMTITKCGGCMVELYAIKERADTTVHGERYYYRYGYIRIYQETRTRVVRPRTPRKHAHVSERAKHQV